MFPFRKLRNIVGLMAVVLLAACNLPRVSPPTPFLTSTPDLTLTAIFSVLYNTPTSELPATASSAPTLADTATFPPPSETLPPAATATDTPLPPTPTHTSVPASPTLGIPDKRPGNSIVGRYLNSSPNIDGNLGDWSLDAYSISTVVYGKDRWDGAKDLSGSVMVGWDEKNLYLGARIVDEDYEQNASGEELYLGDSLEVLLDTKLATDFYYNKLSPDDFQLGISPGSPVPGDHPEAYLWFPSSIKGGRSDVRIGAVRTDDGYNVEVAIPWSIFEMTPQNGGHYGFGFSVSDNDKDGSKLQQSMISTAPNRSLSDPTTWGDLLLSKP
jgi:hypothetical protein